MPTPTPGRTVVIRNESDGADQRILRARLEPARLVVEGHDMGPSTPDGDEYEWGYVIDGDRLTELRIRLGCDPDAPQSALLEAILARAAAFERLTDGLRTEFWNYP